ncbi:hypothetical protein SAMN05444169_1397 [Bradyrhizobium erythrophlei]|uniref:Uncharacterized protein n=1 Tax=Bradyrhizobium erythrophlei TaxID=1437360 RepID=A0A1M5I9J0_9BRAD|nr:hypothetical protein SAMN05444169_1397 [Bradyrhizobium erythrophlei]
MERGTPVHSNKPAGLTGGFFYCHSLTINIAVVDLRCEGAVMKIVLRVVGPLFVAVGLFCFAQGTGLLTWPHNTAMVDYGAGIVAVGFGLVWFGWQ